MADVRRLKQNRATIKGQMTRINNTVDENTSVAEAKVKSTKIESLWEAFQEVQKKIDDARLEGIEVAADEEVLPTAEQEAERQIFENVYFEAATKIQMVLDTAQAANQVQAQVARAEPQNEDGRRGRGERRMEVKLPTLKLPEFSGNYNEWLLFKDAFTSLIHENDTLTEIQKYQYLRSSVTGEAFQVIGGLATTAANYENAWDLLLNNYEHPRLLINTHLSQLLDFPAVSKDKPATMRQLIVHVRTHLKALETLELPVDKWDELLIHLLKNRMDYNTQKSWEEETKKDKENRPTLENFLIFLNEQVRTLEIIDKTKGKSEASKTPAGKKQERKVALATTSQEGCVLCSKNHQLYRCPDFLQLSSADRLKEVKAKKLCMNCLSKGHFSAACKSSACRRCQKKHNTLLHPEQEKKTATDKKSEEDASKKAVVMHGTHETLQDTEESSSVINLGRKPTSCVVLSTARVIVHDVNGGQHKCRALLDAGSQSNLITQELVDRLRLKCKRRDEVISGINRSQTNVGKTVEVKIRSMNADYEVAIECLVLPAITERLPQVKINTKLICLPEGLSLADPDFHTPGTVDILIGAGLFWQLICKDYIQRPKGIPRLQRTLLGWIVGGELLDARSETPRSFCGLITNAQLQAQLERFWKQEETLEKRSLTQEEIECERQFHESVKRDETGRFIVTLPKKPGVKLGDSGNQALQRLYSLERRFRGDPALKNAYVQFMEDYETQGHMSLMGPGPDTSTKVEQSYILPHHPVIKPDSTTTKLRVVFNASAKTSLGTSLNDKLFAGPNKQKSLFCIVLRFRSHPFVITADIAAMFRQILVCEEDRDLQLILWRSDPSQPVQIFRMNTVTYGTACAPYLALSCLERLAIEELERFLKATLTVEEMKKFLEIRLKIEELKKFLEEALDNEKSEFLQAILVLLEDFYMDDVLSGASTIEGAIALRQQLSELLQRGQFQLRKWRSNDPRILEELPESNDDNSFLKIDKEGAMKTLGLLWDAQSDVLQYSVSIEENSRVTKRLVLSQIAQIYDPLGLLGPVVIIAKCIMQSLWQIKTGWDEVLPTKLEATWKEYYKSLPQTNELKIPRNINPGNVSNQFDLVGFGDASERAYGAVLYAVSQRSGGTLQAHLICSKSRVAPLKTISLPRLELDAALLLTKLTEQARKAYGDRIRNVSLFSDSTVVLNWIAESPNIRKTYVANRITKIQLLSQGVTWRHVPSKDNPADLLSRGMSVEMWRTSQLWWQGPEWLITDRWPEQPEILGDTSEMKITALIATRNEEYDILRRFSDYGKLQRIVAYCLRFKANLLGAKRSGPLTPAEIEQAETIILKTVQREVFLKEVRALEQQQSIPKGSKLSSLSPILDQEGVIRVGGRLSQADIPETQKHPILLPAKHHVTTILMRKEHLQASPLRPGAVALLNTCKILAFKWTTRSKQDYEELHKMLSS
ncbi:uncharacterized protein [Temnothorax longispinosus]|uniref:uncharacterized protein n=1 Tax=Temnothorax longispinosus TaxID=300112 RepID=UPI003A9A5333